MSLAQTLGVRREKSKPRPKKDEMFRCRRDRVAFGRNVAAPRAAALAVWILLDLCSNATLGVGFVLRVEHTVVAGSPDELLT